ncbi:hypothetical protein CRUP_017479 [Coryphaenoides rupestris]|nr:hypothetical protein CRUP_017479 [Coryphaenoides rupestris]
MKDFDLEQMNGTWYLVGFSTNAEWFVKAKLGMTVGLTAMVPTEGGDLDFSYSMLQ